MAADELSQFPRPSVAVDLALLTALPPRPEERVGHLAVLMQPHATDRTGMALPGRFLRERRTVVQTVAEVLDEKVGLSIRPTRPRLLKVFDDPARDERGWTLSLAHALSLPHQELSQANGELIPIDLSGDLHTGGGLLFDHGEIVRDAAATIRERYERRPDPDRLLAEPFTLGELRALHEAVLGEPLRKDTFNRRMKPHLQPIREEQDTPVLRSSGGRPAQVYVPLSRHRLSPSDQRRLLLPREH